MNRTRVYYNSACPVCRTGIENQQCRMAQQGNDDIEWIDIHANPERIEEIDASLEFVRERLHVQTEDETVHVGADAFTALFRQTRGQRWLAGLLRLPGMNRLARLTYNGFARRLYRWNRRKGHW